MTCPSCRQDTYGCCGLDDACAIRVCSNCDHNTHDPEQCDLRCPECGDHFDNGDHVTIGAITTCYGVTPAVPV